jgi:hypothetical protein
MRGGPGEMAIGAAPRVTREVAMPIRGASSSRPGDGDDPNPIATRPSSTSTLYVGASATMRPGSARYA